MNINVIIDVKKVGSILAGAAVGYVIGRRERKKKSVAAIYETDPESYNRIYDERATSWQPEEGHNLLFLKCQEDYANRLLMIRGHVMLNDVYDMLGFERTSAGAVVGWVKSNEKYVDFGVKELPGLDDQTSTIFLDFNVQGLVFDKI
jgi:hemolysin activation/secretion protein